MLKIPTILSLSFNFKTMNNIFEMLKITCNMLEKTLKDREGDKYLRKKLTFYLGKEKWFQIR